MNTFTLGGHTIKFTPFSDGDMSCVLPSYIEPGASLNVSVRDIPTFLFQLQLIKEAMDAEAVGPTVLSMLYMPCARADRRFVSGQSFSLKVAAKIINSLNFLSVILLDPHSDVSTALIDRVEIIPQLNGVKWKLGEIQKVSDTFKLCAPDIGAAKKMFDVAVGLGRPHYLQALKIRDVTTGNIIRCDVPQDDLKGQDILIVDDICDGGASFIHLSKQLRQLNCGKVMLYVSHGIFSKGLEPLKGHLDYIFVGNLMNSSVNLTHFNYKG